MMGLLQNQIEPVADTSVHNIQKDNDQASQSMSAPYTKLDDAFNDDFSSQLDALLANTPSQFNAEYNVTPSVNRKTDSATLSERQYLLEQRALNLAADEALAALSNMRDKKLMSEVIMANKLEQQWSTALTAAITEEQQRCLSREPTKDRTIYGGYLLLLDPDILSHITIRETLAATLGPEQGSSLLRVVMSIGEAVEAAVAASESLPKGRSSGLQARKKILEASLSTKANGNAGGKSNSASRAELVRRSMNAAATEALNNEWPPAVRAKLGAALLHMLMKCAYVHVDEATGRLAEEEGVFGLEEIPVRERVTLSGREVVSPPTATTTTAVDSEGAKAPSLYRRSSMDALFHPMVTNLKDHMDGKEDVMLAMANASDQAKQAGKRKDSVSLLDSLNEEAGVMTVDPAAASDITYDAAWASLGFRGSLAVKSSGNAATSNKGSKRSSSPSAAASKSASGARVSIRDQQAQALLEGHTGLPGIRNYTDYATEQSAKDGEGVSAESLRRLGLSPDMEMPRGFSLGKAKNASTPSASSASSASETTSETTSETPQETQYILNSHGIQVPVKRSTGRGSAVRDALSPFAGEGGTVSVDSADFPYGNLNMASAEEAVDTASDLAMSTPRTDATSTTTTSTTSTTSGIGAQQDPRVVSRILRMQSLATRAASRTPYKRVVLPNGKSAFAVPAFMHEYVWTQSKSSSAASGGADGSTSRNSPMSNVYTDPTAPRSAGSPVSLRYVGMIFSHPRLLDLLSSRAALLSHVAHFPMVVPPLQWKAFAGSGPYLAARVPLMRTSRAHRDIVAQAVRTPGRMETVLAALNVLGSTAWKINPFVLENVKKVWGEDGQVQVPGHPLVPDFPPFAEADPPLPEPWVADDPEVLKLTPQERMQKRNAWSRESRRILQKRHDNHGLRCDFRLKLNVAEEHQNDEAIYFPHNMDFRGRVYPIPPHLNHMGSDIARGLLTFADPVQLGTGSGLRWLQVHLSNLMGKDKVSFSDRVAFVESHTAEIMAAGENPLSDKGDWWLKADKPWQALATMKELSEVYKMPFHARHLYGARIPVHMDGSCNGLQHYAALGLDTEGAKAVNLSNNEEDKPADVYSRVLHIVNQRIRADAALPVEAAKPSAARVGRAREDTSIFAKKVAESLDSNPELMETVAPLKKMAAEFLLGHVDRKVVKQTVMTSVYGVTFIGARDQIWNRLREKFTPETTPHLSQEELEYMLHACAQYLARTTLSSLGDLFASADAIKAWLGDVSAGVAAREQPMSWITPLGLPCVQPYRAEDRFPIRTVMQDLILRDPGEPGLPVHKSRQRSAFPPNFVHSLDSSHMFLTALAAKRQGITFAAVHDSYWTHPSSVDIMRDSLRREFVNLYQQPILEDLAQSLKLRFPGLEIPPLPERGNFDLKEVLNARYFFG